MNKDFKHCFTCGTTDKGKWLAVSTRVPYFCFEGSSQEEVEGLANRALDFYFGVRGSVSRKSTAPARKARETTLSTFSPVVVQEKQCVNS